PDWLITGLVGQGSLGSVYRIMPKDTAAPGSQQPCAIKVISVPQNEHIYSRMVSELGGPNNVREYLKGILAAIDKELTRFESTQSLGKNTVSYLDHKVVPHDHDFGYDVLIRMEYLNPFSKFILQNRPDEEMIIRMGIDLCESLQAAERMKIVHRNIKPENVFMSSDRAFMLGDHCMSSIADAMTFSPMSAGSTYTVPEVYRKELYDNRADIYSLGLLMYRLLNENRDPYMDSKGNLITFEARNEALNKRLSAEYLPDPLHGSPELKGIIKKACAGAPAAALQMPAK
ncbi:MAG: protein kinase, partial [Faecalicoccus sp.]|nr:protein kinase [Faecalicoccus sp.]